MANEKSESGRGRGGRRIIGFSLPPDLAREVKAEAAKRDLSLRQLFEELWEQYRKKHRLESQA